MLIVCFEKGFDRPQMTEVATDLAQVRVPTVEAAKRRFSKVLHRHLQVGAINRWHAYWRESGALERRVDGRPTIGGGVQIDDKCLHSGARYFSASRPREA